MSARTAAGNARDGSRSDAPARRVQPGNRYFPRKQTLHYMVGYQQEAGQEPIMVAEERQAAVDTIKAEPTCSGGAGRGAAAAACSALPKWIEHDRKVLRFFGYFQEHVPESPVENARVRRVVVLHYLEDDTLQISEPQQDNSGLPQVPSATLVASTIAPAALPPSFFADNLSFASLPNSGSPGFLEQLSGVSGTGCLEPAAVELARLAGAETAARACRALC